MTKAISLLLFILLLYPHCHAQGSRIDSLREKLQSHPQEDTGKVNLMISYGYHMARNSRDSAYAIADEIIKLSKKINWKTGEANGLLLLCELHATDLKYDTAIALAMQSLTIAEPLHANRTIHLAHRNLSEIYRMMGNDSLTIYHAKKCLELANIEKDKYSVLAAEMTLYNLYSEMGNKTETAKYAKQAMASAIEQKNEFYIARIYEIEGYSQFDEKDFIHSLANYRQALALYKKLAGYPYIAYVETQLSRIFSILDIKDSAAYYANQALEITTLHNLKKERIDVYETLFNNAYESGDYKKAIGYRLTFDSLQDDMKAEQMSRNAERIRIESEQKKKDAYQLAEQQKKDAAAKSTRNLQLTIIIFTLLVAAFLFWNNRQKQKAKERIETAYIELKSTQAQLVQSEKMASLGQLTAGIAHEIQNPLNFVNNFSEVNKELAEELKSGLASGNQQLLTEIANDIIDNSEKINHHGKRADSIVKSMLQHSRTNEGIKEPADINALCDEYLRLSYHGFKAKNKSFNVVLKTEFENNTGSANIISQDIGRVLLNLYNNAFYALEEKQKTAGSAYQPTLVVKTRRKNDKIEIIVRDNGNGIPPNIVEKIFQPFFTTKPTGRGTGLGLSLSYDIIKAHAGEIQVSIDEGTTFTLLLPVN